MIFINKAKIGIVTEGYFEYNNFNINIRCDINDFLDVYISYKNIEKIELFNSFIEKLIEYLNKLNCEGKLEFEIENYNDFLKED